MSLAPVIVECPSHCKNGIVIRYYPLNHCERFFKIKDICERCGGSGKVVF